MGLPAQRGVCAGPGWEAAGLLPFGENLGEESEGKVTMNRKWFNRVSLNNDIPPKTGAQEGGRRQKRQVGARAGRLSPLAAQFNRRVVPACFPVFARASTPTPSGKSRCARWSASCGRPLP